MVEYQKKASSSVSKAALATAIGAGVVALNGGGNILGGIIPGAAVRAGYAAPVAAPVAVSASGCGYVTDKEMDLIRESSSKDAVIAQLSAEKYADAAIKAEVEPLKVRICNLETQAAVNAARDHDFRRYVDAEFIHQPKASINESIVVCQQCGCHKNDCCCGGKGFHGNR